MSQEPPAPGTRIGAFTCDRLLGQGGFAWVYAAHRDDGKSLALKVLKPRYANDPAFESRFRQESAFAAELRHPNIVQIEDVGVDQGLAYFSMELHPGSLRGRLEQTPVLDEPEVVRIAAGVAQALAFAHERNVIHRDIKPDNILLAEDGRPVLTDFGIARAVSGYVAATGFMMTIGTPAYVSPEQAQGRTLDGRSDLYSLGITMYRMVTGEVPFKSPDWFELARMHVEDTPEAPRTRRPELSKRVERIILRLLAKHPDDRYPTALALLEDLGLGPTRRVTSDIPIPGGFKTASDSPPSGEEPEARERWWKVW
ncbi:MAG: serine/threonine protein kinase [Gemmatimonadota bacterium]|nr:serine/threonine protein kinase [Gemmatimonadota bacterium]